NGLVHVQGIVVPVKFLKPDGVSSWTLIGVNDDKSVFFYLVAEGFHGGNLTFRVQNLLPSIAKINLPRSENYGRACVGISHHRNAVGQCLHGNSFCDNFSGPDMRCLSLVKGGNEAYE